MICGSTPASADEAVVYAQGFVSTTTGYELNAVFDARGERLLFTREVNGVAKIFEVRQDSAEGCTYPRMVAFSDIDSPWNDVDPWFGGDGHIYFVSNRPVDGYPSGSVNIWVVNRRDTGEISVELVPFPTSSASEEIYPITTRDQSMYFTSTRSGGLGDRDLYVARPRNSGGVEVSNVGPPVNTEHSDGDVFVSLDDRLMIITSDRPGGFGGADLYASRRASDGSWSEPANLGGAINTSEHEYAPIVTDGGKYLFFTRGGDIYWIRWDGNAASHAK